MSIKVHNEPIPDGKLEQFDELLKAYGGRYLLNPYEAPDRFGRWRVAYEYEDSEAFHKHQKAWLRMTTDVREVRKDQWWRRLWRRLTCWNNA